MTDIVRANMRVIRQGRVLVNSASVVASSQNIACVEIDLRSKYAEELGASSTDGGAPCIYFAATPETLHVNELEPADALTEIAFPDYAGWDIFSSHGPGRYTYRIVFVKRAAIYDSQQGAAA